MLLLRPAATDRATEPEAEVASEPEAEAAGGGARAEGGLPDGWLRLRVSWGNPRDMYQGAKELQEVVVSTIGLDGRLAVAGVPNGLPIVEWVGGREGSTYDTVITTTTKKKSVRIEVPESAMYKGRYLVCRHVQVAEHGGLECELATGYHFTGQGNQDPGRCFWKDLCKKDGAVQVRFVNAAAQAAAVRADAVQQQRAAAGREAAARSGVLSAVRAPCRFYRTLSESTPLLSAAPDPSRLSELKQMPLSELRNRALNAGVAVEVVEAAEDRSSLSLRQAALMKLLLSAELGQAVATTPSGASICDLWNNSSRYRRGFAERHAFRDAS